MPRYIVTHGSLRLSHGEDGIVHSAKTVSKDGKSILLPSDPFECAASEVEGAPNVLAVEEPKAPKTTPAK